MDDGGDYKVTVSCDIYITCIGAQELARKVSEMMFSLGANQVTANIRNIGEYTYD